MNKFFLSTCCKNTENCVEQLVLTLVGTILQLPELVFYEKKYKNKTINY